LKTSTEQKTDLPQTEGILQQMAFDLAQQYQQLASSLTAYPADFGLASLHHDVN